MKIVDSTYFIGDNNDYEQCFGKIIDKESNPPKTQRLKLYEVDFYNPRKECYFLHYVLADSVKGAISQACCAESGVFEFNCNEKYKEIHSKSRVRHLPFLIRGWGKTQF